jgi:hypothetical protein
MSAVTPSYPRQIHTVRETPRHATTHYPHTDNYHLYTNKHTNIHKVCIFKDSCAFICFCIFKYIKYGNSHSIRTQRYIALKNKRLLTHVRTLIQTSIPTSKYIHSYTYIHTYIYTYIFPFPIVGYKREDLLDIHVYNTFHRHTANISYTHTYIHAHAYRW